MIEHHDALRLRFVREATGWRQFQGEARESVVEHVDLAAVPDAERDAAMESIAAGLHRSLDLAEGPLIRVALITSASAP